jgi:hypothetical protein
VILLERNTLMGILDEEFEEWKGFKCRRCGDYHEEDPSGCRDPDCPMHEEFASMKEG